jgi:hypothetical protein
MSVWESAKIDGSYTFNYVDGDAFSGWMRTKNVKDVGEYLKKQKYEYRWVRENPPKVESEEDAKEARWMAQINGNG